MTKKPQPSSNFFGHIWKATIGKLNTWIEEAYLKRQARLTGCAPAELDPHGSPESHADVSHPSKPGPAAPQPEDRDEP